MTGCNSCEALVINGVFCHEAGCPDAWRNRKKKCVCGELFQPREKLDVFCDGCADQGDEHECDSDASVDCDICPDCKEHAGFCSVCGMSDCCGAL